MSRVSKQQKKRDIILQLFMLYVTPLCVYLQSLFFAKNNIIGAGYIAVLCMMMIFSRKLSLKVTRTDIFFFIFLLIALVSTLRANEYLYFLQVFLVLLFVFEYTKYDLKALYHYMDIMVVFGILCAIACIVQEIWSGFYEIFVSKLFKSEDYEIILKLKETKGNCGLMPQTSHAAGCILNAFFILSMKKGRRQKKIVLGMLLFIGLLLTGKRAHLFMGVFVYFLTFFIGYQGKKQFRKYIVGAVIVCVSMVGLVTLAPYLPEDNPISKGINTIQNFDINDEDTMHGRELLYAEAFSMGTSAPLTGHGWGSFKKTVEYRGGSTDVHNIYLQLFAEQGIIILTIFMTAAIILIISSIKLLSYLRYAYSEDSMEMTLAKLSFCFILFFYLYGLTGNGLYNVDFLIVLGVGVSIHKKIQQIVKVHKYEEVYCDY